VPRHADLTRLFGDLAFVLWVRAPPGLQARDVSGGPARDIDVRFWLFKPMSSTPAAFRPWWLLP